MMQGKRVLLGIGGGIAVYRVAELARLLIRQGAQVRCVMTRGACQFVTPMTFEALTSETVHLELFDLTREREMGHIQLARWADAVVLAPATANMIAHLAHGIADDLLSTLMLVCEAPVLLAPAMNTSMWQAAATRRNVEILKSRGYRVVGPASGELACGEQGEGRLAEPSDIADALVPLLVEQCLRGQRWVINAGPTEEAWDAVRLLTNRATGTLGAHLANQAAVLGAQVDLIAGPGTPQTREVVRRTKVRTANEMLQACRQTAASADVFVATAAVSDFSFADSVAAKLKRGDTQTMSVMLTVNPDIVREIAAMPARPTNVIAFAAETDEMLKHAREKLVRKGVDAIVANPASNMGKVEAGACWVTAEKEEHIEQMDKRQLARVLIDKIMRLQG